MNLLPSKSITIADSEGAPLFTCPTPTVGQMISVIRRSGAHGEDPEREDPAAAIRR